MLGLLLARAGVEVTVLEKHADFLRDFRGDTVHPSTLSLLEDLGLFDRFDALTQTRVKHVRFPTPDGEDLLLADFTRLRRRHRHVAMVPQWDLLNLLAQAASEEPGFTLLTEHEVTGVLWESEQVTGVDYASPAGSGRLLADLTVACDGRTSAVRRDANMPSKEFPVGFDAWWFRIPTTNEAGQSLLPRTKKGRVAIAIPRQGYLQVAQLGFKGTDAAVRARGVAAFRVEVTELFPEAADGIARIESMDEVRHLNVRVDRLRRWHRPGVLCIGDAAHAMSPVGGVGLNLAVQDAVAAARILAGPLLRGVFTEPTDDADRVLRRVQRRRSLPTIATQSLQRILHYRLIMPALQGKAVQPPRALTALVRRVPSLAAVPAYVIGVGLHPERAPAWARQSAAPGANSTADTPKHPWVSPGPADRT